jgi:hypothetical protein
MISEVKMLSKVKQFAHPFTSGFFTGATAHLAGAIVVSSSDQIAHFVGHVVAVIILRVLHR